MGEAPDWGKWVGRPWGPELENVIKRMYHILIRIGRGPRLRKLGREALGPRIGKCHKENMSYFNKALEEPKIVENRPEGPELKN